MNESASRRIEEVRQLGVKALRARFRELFTYEAPRFLHRGALGRRVLWQEQALEHGGLSEETKRRLDELAREPALNIFPDQAMVPTATAPAAGEKRSFKFRAKSNPRLPLPGTVLVRQYRGREVRAAILPNGVEYEDRVFASLSALANELTGTHTSGMAWFGLAKRRAARTTTKDAAK